MDWGLVLISLVGAVFVWYVLTALRWLLDAARWRVGRGQQLAGHHAVTIVPGEVACEHSRRVARRRVLAAEAPGLPLQACDAKECTCIYRHFDDRRAAQRRAPVHVGAVKSNRRMQQPGRRYEDGLVSG